jgi:hypothetical protein
VKKLLFIIAVFGLFFSAPNLIAQSSYNAVSNAGVKENCKNAQIYINKTVRKNDLRTRVDRLQLYEYISQHLDSLTQRLENNNQPRAKQMRGMINGYRKKIDAFKINYEKYDYARDRLTNLVDCQTETTKFIELLEETRIARSKVAASVVVLKKYVVTETSDQLDVLQKELLNPELGGSI